MKTFALLSESDLSATGTQPQGHFPLSPRVCVCVCGGGVGGGWRFEGGRKGKRAVIGPSSTVTERQHWDKTTWVCTNVHSVIMAYIRNLKNHHNKEKKMQNPNTRCL